MKRLFLLALGLTACGAAPRGGSVPMGLLLPSNLTNGVAQVQIVFARTDTLSCTQYMTASPACFARNAFAGDAITVTGPDGKATNHVVFSLSIPDGGTGSQTISVSGVPVGRQYTVIVEAIDAAGLLAGHGCGLTTGPVNPGGNDGVTVNVTDATACNPSF